MPVLRHLAAGAAAVTAGAGLAQWALTAHPDPGPRSQAGSPTYPRPAPAPAQKVVAPAEDTAGLPACDGAPDCTDIAGRVLYVESVDPDGDGDLHVVVFDPRSISAPGLTSIDVAADLRPAEDPRVGDRVAAKGPVQRGSYGQDQIHALDFVDLSR